MEVGNKRNGKAIASLIVSCIAILNCCMWYLAILCGVVGIVLGILALRDDNKRQQDLAVAGIVVGGTGLALGIVAAVLYIMLSTAQGDGTAIPELENGADTVLTALRNLALPYQ